MTDNLTWRFALTALAEYIGNDSEDYGMEEFRAESNGQLGGIDFHLSILTDAENLTWSPVTLHWTGSRIVILEPSGALAWTPDEELERGVNEFKRLWPDKWAAWLKWCDVEDTK